MPARADIENIAIRPAAEADGEAMAALHALCFDPSWEDWVMRSFVKSDSCVCLVAAAMQSHLTGLVIAQVAAGEAELITLAVNPERRRARIATSLLHATSDTLRDRGALCLFFDVDENNSAARALYRDLGAREVGRRAGYYANGADALVLRLDL